MSVNLTLFWSKTSQAGIDTGGSLAFAQMQTLYNGGLNTTDATPTEVFHWSTPTNYIAICGYAVAQISATKESALYRIEGLVKVSGGVGVLVNSVVTTIAEDAALAGCTVAVAASGTGAKLVITGLALTTIGWQPQVSVITL